VVLLEFCGILHLELIISEEMTMKNRSPVAVVLLTLVTFGIYGIYWEVSTKMEMVKRGADIPTAWLIIVPIANLWWIYKYCLGVEKVTEEKMSGVLALVLMLVLSVIGMAIIQDAFNKVGESTAPVPAQA
jgi:uncharacterized membrane protein YhaH (DUF805 family)